MDSCSSDVVESSESLTITLKQPTGLSVSTKEIISSNETQVPTQTNDGLAKSHKVEGKNKKSLHHKQQQQRKQQPQSPKQTQSQQSQQPNQIASNGTRRGIQKNINACIKPPSSPNNTVNSPTAKDAFSTTFSTLEEFSKRAQELKKDINQALEKQASHKFTDQPVEVVKLKDDILRLSGLEAGTNLDAEGKESSSHISIEGHDSSCKLKGKKRMEKDGETTAQTECEKLNNSTNKMAIPSSLDSLSCKHRVLAPNQQLQYPQDKNTSSDINLQTIVDTKSSQENFSHDNIKTSQQLESSCGKIIKKTTCYKSDTNLNQALDKLTLAETKIEQSRLEDMTKKSNLKKQNLPLTKITSDTNFQDSNKSDENVRDEFELLNAKLDADSKFVALYSSLQKQFDGITPYLLETICRKLVSLSDQNNQLASNCEKFQSENQRLNSVKQKLENLCRELQKSNNAIRIESLDLIKVEQGKAKDQTAKIQLTLTGVIKLFDENQQRNMSLRQENQELQMKLKSLLDHCDNWEKSVEAALRQRDIENRLIKTELAKANLLKNEEKEKFLGEKQELLQILSMMQEQQHRIEGQEAKLRSDLSSYASKYDECQAVISKGMNRFQTESKRMLKQIEKSKQDYKVLLSKYETSNKRMAQLLEEKQCWDRAMNLANRKIETLEKLCRALSDRKTTNSNCGCEVTTNIKKSASKNKSNKCQKHTTEEQQQENYATRGTLNKDVKIKDSVLNVTNGLEMAPSCEEQVGESMQCTHESC